MTTVSWHSNVNKKFFDFTESYKDNSIVTEYASGRKSVINKNTRFLKTFECSLALNVKNGEFQRFKTWFENTLGGLSNAFTCSTLGNGAYRFSEMPKFDKGLSVKIAELKIEEVY